MVPEYIRPAEDADVAALLEIRAEAERWLAVAGVDQWNDAELGGRAVEKWRGDIAEGRTWVVEQEGRTVATFTLAQPDMDFWRPEDDLEAALYVAKLITARRVAGTNLGGRILDWVAARAEREGRPWVRLDVWRTNLRLQRYYEREGFAHVRTESPSHRRSGWLGQRPSVLRLHQDVPPLTVRVSPLERGPQQACVSPDERGCA